VTSAQRIRVRLWIAVCALSVMAFNLPSPAVAQDEEARSQALKEITQTAKDICEAPPMGQSSSSVAVQGSANAQVSQLVRKLANLGISGAPQYQSTQSMGVLQKDLAETIKSSNDCRLQVFKTLQAKLLPDASSSLAFPESVTEAVLSFGGNTVRIPASLLRMERVLAFGPGDSHALMALDDLPPIAMSVSDNRLYIDAALTVGNEVIKVQHNSIDPPDVGLDSNGSDSAVEYVAQDGAPVLQMIEEGQTRIEIFGQFAGKNGRTIFVTPAGIFFDSPPAEPLKPIFRHPGYRYKGQFAS
jgi:hypothetical protein